MTEDQKSAFTKPLNVLIVEDNEVDRKVLESMLVDSSPTVSSIKITNSLNSTLKILEQNEFDVVILDLNLPDSKGQETLVELNERYPQMAVVVNTGAYEDTLGLKTLSYGAQDFLVKGKYSSYLLNKTLRYAVERKRLELELIKTYEKLKSTQAELIQAEKMKVIGDLASGVAHEVKNPLAIILYGITYLSDHLKGQDDTVKSILMNIKDAIDRANNIVTDLLNFSSLTHFKLETDDLNIVIEKSLGLLKHELERNHIDVEKNFISKISTVKMDKNRIEQVLINLILNSIQAMPSGGRLKIETVDLKVTPDFEYFAYYKGNGLKSGQRVLLLNIEDTGNGIPSENLMKIFSPFFTTKRAHGGVGLGLAVSKNIMEIHNGYIFLKNKEEGGAKATLIFKV